MINTHTLIKSMVSHGFTEAQAEFFVTHFVTREEFDNYVKDLDINKSIKLIEQRLKSMEEAIRNKNKW